MDTVRVKIKRIDKTIPVPEYKTAGAAALDVSSRTEVVVAAYSVGKIPLNICLEIPEGYWVLLASRSSTYKMGLMPANGIGVGDWDFRGDNDEFQFVAYNYTDKEVIVPAGTRVGQIMILPRPRVELEEVDSFGNKDRGGFGTTGNR